MVRTRLVHIFREFPVLDPELPEELAPLGSRAWSGGRDLPLAV